MKTLILRSCSDLNNTLQVKISEKLHQKFAYLFQCGFDVKKFVISEVLDDRCGVYFPHTFPQRITSQIHDWVGTLSTNDDFVVVDF